MIDFNHDQCRCPCCGELYPAEMVDAIKGAHEEMKKALGPDVVMYVAGHGAPGGIIVIGDCNTGANLIELKCDVDKFHKQLSRAYEIVEEFYDDAQSEANAEYHEWMRELARLNRLLWGRPVSERTVRNVRPRQLRPGRFLAGVPP